MTTAVPPTANPSARGSAAHAELAYLNVHVSPQGAAGRRTGHVQFVVPAATLPHEMYAVEPWTTSAYRALPAGTEIGVVSVIVVSAYGDIVTPTELVVVLCIGARGKYWPDACVDHSSTVSAPKKLPPPRHMLSVSMDTSLAALA